MFTKGNENWKARKSNKGGRPRTRQAKPREPEPAVIETSCETVADDTVNANDVVDDTVGGNDVTVMPLDINGMEDEVEGYIPYVAHPKKAAFLTAYGEIGNVVGAAAAAQCSPRMHYYWAKRDEAYCREFETRRLLYSEKLIAEVHKRAMDGEKKSDILLIFATKGIRKEYSDSAAAAAQINIGLGPSSLAITHHNGEGKREFDFDKFRQLLKP